MKFSKAKIIRTNKNGVKKSNSRYYQMQLLARLTIKMQNGGNVSKQAFILAAKLAGFTENGAEKQWIKKRTYHNGDKWIECVHCENLVNPKIFQHFCISCNNKPMAQRFAEGTKTKG